VRFLFGGDRIITEKMQRLASGLVHMHCCQWSV
jgi:hypothetical protein